MSYRIQVQPEAGSDLRTLAPHVVLRLGQSLAEVAEAVASGAHDEHREVRVGDCVLQFVVDHAQGLLRVTGVDGGPILAEARA